MFYDMFKDEYPVAFEYSEISINFDPFLRWGRMSITNASNLLITQVLNALKQRLWAIMESKYRPYLAQTVCMCTFLDEV